MKKLAFVSLVLVFFLLPFQTVYAKDINNNNEKISVVPFGYERFKDNIITVTIDDIENKLPKLTFIGSDHEMVDGIMTYPNITDKAIGNFDLRWIFTPSNDKYSIATGFFHLYIYPEDSDISKGKIPEPETVDVPTTPSLTATTVQLGAKTSYDINLNDKVSGCSYLWSSSDTDVVTVNSKNGLLKAVSEGTATITCKITYPDETKQTLKSLVTVGYDDNAPVLTETELDLNPDDVFDINLENKVAKSKYRWVSSDKTVVVVNSSNGIVTAKSIGTAFVTCTITTPENQVIVLQCSISVTEKQKATDN
mgnify:CR=1 FL=1